MKDYNKYQKLRKKFKEITDKKALAEKDKKKLQKNREKREELMKKMMSEQVMSGAVGSAPLHHGTLLPMIRRPMLGYGLIPFEGLVKKKKKKKKKLNETTMADRSKDTHDISPHNIVKGRSVGYDIAPGKRHSRKKEERVFTKENFQDYITSIPIGGWGNTNFKESLKTTRRWKGFDEKKALQWAREAAGKPSIYLLMRKALTEKN
jgi:hypothetical protein